MDIELIKSDKTLSAKEKFEKIQKLNNDKNKKMNEEINDNKISNLPSIEEMVKSCKHYNIKCNIICKCCDLEFPCRHCHNEYMGIMMDRYNLTEIVCRECHTKQGLSNTCIDCNISFANTHCDKCNIWTDIDQSYIFHCDKCNICFLNEDNIDFYHCDECNTCHATNDKKCSKQSKLIISYECGVCKKTNFDSSYSTLINDDDGNRSLSSNNKTRILNCGHTLHSQCMENLCRDNIIPKCPICKKSLCSPDHWNLLDNIRNQEFELNSVLFEGEYKDWKVNIDCNDCSENSNSKYHPILLKCDKCGSYNTQKNKIITPDINNNTDSNNTNDSNL